MSEAITKECERPSCDNGKRYTLDHNGIIIKVPDCGDCSGTGRVPDVEATLRAQLDAALAEVMRLTEGLSRQMLARDADVERLADELTALQEEMKDRERESEEVARLTAEVERLSQREPTQQECDEADGKPDASGKTWPAGEVFIGTTCRRCIDCGRWAFGGPTRCPYCAGKHNVGVAAQMYLDDLRAANAEVERLKATPSERDGEIVRITGTLAPVRVMHAECPKCGANPSAIITSFRVVTRVVAEPAYEPENGDLDITQTGFREITGTDDETQMTLTCSAGHEWKGQSAT